MGLTSGIVRQISVAMLFLLASSGLGAAQSTSRCPGIDCTLSRDEARATTTKISQLKQEFAEGVRRFLVALTGFIGDANAIRSSVESMDAALVSWDNAIGAFETSLPQSAPSVDVHLTLGTIYLDRHRLNDALREFDEALRQDPRRADVVKLMALAYGLANEPSEAAQALERASALEPNNAITHYELARQHAKMGEETEAQSALRLFRESRARQLSESRSADTTSAPFERVGLLPQMDGVAPIFPPALYASSFALLTEGAYGEAIIRFRQAVTLDPLTSESAQASDRLAQGRAALRQGNLPSALSHLRSAVESEPDRAEAHRILATAYGADGQYDRSVEQFEAAIRANPSDERSRMALADVLATIGQFTRAERVLNDALQVIPNSGRAHFDLGRLYRVLGRYPEAARQFEEATRFSPIVGLDSVYEMIGAIYAGQANFDRAAEFYAKRVDVNPNNADAHRSLGEAHLRQDRDDEAMAEFMVTLLIDPSSSSAYGGLAQAHLRAGKYAEAADTARRALELDPSLRQVRYALATALMRLGKTEEGAKQMEEFRRRDAEATADGRRKYELERIKRDAAVSLANSDYEKAVVLLRQAVSYESTVASTYLALGFALLETGHYAEAIVNLQKSLQLEPGADVHRYLSEAYKALGRLEESRSESELYRQTIDRMKKERLLKMNEGR
jgi:tetratricopeptide (TPR) repeat protein